MKTKIITLIFFAAASFVNAQVEYLDTWINPEEPGGSASTSSSLKMEDLDIKYPATSTHYDDEPKPHYEPKFTENDGGKKWEEGSQVNYYYQREADAKYKKRIWRRIDTRQKMNKSFTWEKSSAVKILYEMAVNGLVRAYYTDSLERFMSPEEAFTAGGKIVPVDILNPANPKAAEEGDFIQSATYQNVTWDKIKKVELMEDWIWDNNYGELRPRIIGVALLYEEVYPNGIKYDMPLFWLKMDDLRPTLAKSEVYNRYNDAGRISWDDLFNQYRLFDSYVVKQTDYDDLYIAYKPEFMTDGLGALLEGKRIEKELFIMEHDVWEF